MRNVKELFSLDGRVAIITGASRGLGREAAEALGEAGAKLVLGARREQWLQPTLHEFRERGFEAVAQPCDITDPQQGAASAFLTTMPFIKRSFKGDRSCPETGRFS